MMPFTEVWKLGRGAQIGGRLAGEPRRASEVPFLYVFKMDNRSNCLGPFHTCQ